MPITLTEAAADHIRHTLEKQGNPAGLRLAITKSGCSGFAYQMDYAQRVEPTDQVFESFGVKLIVASDSLPFLEGTELDFVQEGLNRIFKFNNPNVKDQCGCGESFNV